MLYGLCVLNILLNSFSGEVLSSELQDKNDNLDLEQRKEEARKKRKKRKTASLLTSCFHGKFILIKDGRDWISRLGLDKIFFSSL